MFGQSFSRCFPNLDCSGQFPLSPFSGPSAAQAQLDRPAEARANYLPLRVVALRKIRGANRRSSRFVYHSNSSMYDIARMLRAAACCRDSLCARLLIILRGVAAIYLLTRSPIKSSFRSHVTGISLRTWAASHFQTVPYLDQPLIRT